MQKTWNPEQAAATCKVFHQVFAPDGTLLTKGNGGSFPHHRGLFVGWNRTRYGKQRCDFWHLHKGESQRFLGQLAPSALGMGKSAQVSSIGWFAKDERLVVHEFRGLEILASDEQSYVLHMRVECRTNLEQVELDGDPQHAGQQFRSLQQFAEKGAAPVRYLRPEGAKEHGNDVWTECHWIAGVLDVLDAKSPEADAAPAEPRPYTVLRIEGPNNPGKTTWSTRPYGRFGATRTTTITPKKPLRIDQYYVVANGAQTAAWCQQQAKRWRSQ